MKTFLRLVYGSCLLGFLMTLFLFVFIVVGQGWTEASQKVAAASMIFAAMAMILKKDAE